VSRRAGFTLAEVAVTILIVGMGMLWILQGLNAAKMTAAQTRNMKLSRDLALMTLGQVASGQFQEDVENGLSGTYAEEGYPQFRYEVLVGDESFSEGAPEDGTFDTWRHQQELKEEREARQARESEEEEEKEDPQERDEPFEKVKIRVTFEPKIRVGETEQPNELVLEEWMPWKQVYGEKEEEGTDPAAAGEGTGAPASSSGGGK
jgi:prepilin-type N-terminal cleavage/methylation domain-containing protein